MERVLVLNGPNLNLLGTRERDVYGTATLDELDAMVVAWAEELGLGVETVQSNHEGVLIDRIHESAADGIVINPGALAHYSRALHDAIRGIPAPVVEVHISDIKSREEWRRYSVTAPACDYAIHGRGYEGYRWALRRLVNQTAWPLETIAYGDGPERIADLRLPDGEPPHPVAVLLHGGFWREPWTRDTLDAIAVDLGRRGYASWNVEYHRVGTGGGYPVTLEDVAAAIDHLGAIADRYRLDLNEVVTIGHSAGGQLALWASGRSGLEQDEPGSGPVVSPVLAVGLAPVADLADAHERGIGDGAVEDFLRRSPDTGPERYLASSPAERLPLDVDQLIVHGDADDIVPAAMSRDYVIAAKEAGDDVEYVQLPGVDHFTLIDPASPAWARVVAEI
jgi:3-dehydroquinate dehydratase type II